MNIPQINVIHWGNKFSGIDWLQFDSNLHLYDLLKTNKHIYRGLRFSNTLSAVKYGGGSKMLLGWVVRVNDIMVKDDYIKILKQINLQKKLCRPEPSWKCMETTDDHSNG